MKQCLNWMMVVALAAGLAGIGCSPEGARGGGTGDGGTGNPFGDGGFATFDGSSGSFGDGGGGASEGSCEKMDILFVIDNSGSMSEEQQNLADNFPRFVEVLNRFMASNGNRIDYRVGVTTTGRDAELKLTFGADGGGLGGFFNNIPGLGGGMMMGANGVLRDCGPMRKWLVRSDSNVTSNFQSCAQVGTDGPPMEMPLLMAEWALTKQIQGNGPNAGFLREDALLALVILTDEDDCSRADDPIVTDATDFQSFDSCGGDNLEPVSRFVQAFDRVKGKRGRWATAAIAGPGPGTCSSQFGEAQEASRLKKFVDMAGPNGVFSSICNGDLAAAMETTLQTFDAACQSFPVVK